MLKTRFAGENIKNFWKWIFGIELFGEVLAGLAGAAFTVHNMMAEKMANRQVVINPVPRRTPGLQGEDGPRNGNGPMQGEFRGWRAPGRPSMRAGGRFGFSPFHAGAPFHRPFPFGPGFMILGGLMRLIPLA